MGLRFLAWNDVQRVSVELVNGQGCKRYQRKPTDLRASAACTIESSVDSDMSTIYHNQVSQHASY